MSATTASPSILQGPPRSARAMWRLTWAVLGLAFCSFCGLAVASTLAIKAAVEFVDAPAKIDQVSGIVLYRAADASGQETLSAGTEVYPGDALQVPSGSLLGFHMADGSTVQAIPNTRLRVDIARSKRLGAN